MPIVSELTNATRPHSPRRRRILAIIGTAIAIILASMTAFFYFGDCRLSNTLKLGQEIISAPSQIIWSRYAVGASGCPFWCERRTVQVQLNYIIDCGFKPTDDCDQLPIYKNYDYCANKINNPLRKDLNDRGYK